MANELILAPETEYDIADAYYWYENCRDGLGEEFLNSLNDCFDAILNTPELYCIVHENYRRGLLRRFPYMVFYEYFNDKIIVYGIFHSSRDPQKWRQRLI